MTEPAGDSTKRDGRVLPLPLQETVEDARLIALPGRPLGDTVGDSGVLQLPGSPAQSGLDTVAPRRAAPGPGLAQVAGFRLEAELGRGGMGVVYRAHSLALDRPVALKVLRAGDAADDEEVGRFQLEARAAARLRHPNVVGLHEVGRDGDRWFMVMDLIEGESLRARILRDGPLPPRDVVRWGLGLARALAHAHAQGILHRDLKPHNVLIDSRSGEAVLTDFGLAKEVHREGEGLTVTGQVLGTPAYMSPEQAAGDGRRVGPASDLYGLGATLYEALTGQPPFSGPTAINVLRAVIEDEPAPPSRLRPGLPRDLETVVLACLEKDPARRYASAADLAADLERVVQLEPIAARRVGPLERAWRWLSRRRALVAAAALFVALALGAWLVTLARARREEDRRRAAVEQALARAGTDPRGDVAAAESALEVADAWARTSPDSADAQAARRTAARLMGERARWKDSLEKAALGFEVAADAGDPDGRAAAAWCRELMIAQLEFDERVYGRAATRLETLLAQGRPWGQAAAGLAVTRLSMRDLDGALEAALAATRIEPEHPIGWVGLARVRLKRREHAAALASADRAVELAAGAAPVLSLRSAVRLEAGDLPGAIEDATRALAVDPFLLEAATVRANVRLMQGAGREALEDAELLMRLAPGQPLPLSIRATARIWAGDLAGARLDIEALRRLGPSALGEALDGRLLLLEGRAAEAIAVFDRALALDPANADAHQGRGEALHALGRLDDALQELERTTALVPGRPHAWFLRARACYVLERFREAREHASKALAIAPDLVEALALRGHAALALGDRAGAAADLARAASLPCADAAALSARGLLQAALDHWEAARDDLDAALALDPGDVESRAHRARVHLELHEAAASEADASTILAADPDHAVALQTRGLARAAQRDPAARADLQRALELDLPEPLAAEARDALRALER